jgi:hypothetical protein
MSHIDIVNVCIGLFLCVCLIVLLGGVLATWGVKPSEPESEATVEQYLHRQERGID